MNCGGCGAPILLSGLCDYCGRRYRVGRHTYTSRPDHDDTRTVTPQPGDVVMVNWYMDSCGLFRVT